MIISCCLYNKVLCAIKKFKRFDSTSFDSLISSFPEIEKAALTSIFNHFIRRQTMLKTKLLKNNSKTITRLYNKMAKKGETFIFISLAEKYGVTPVCIARLVLESIENETTAHGSNESRPWDMIKDSTLIRDATLSYEVHLASLFDPTYSPTANSVAKYGPGLVIYWFGFVESIKGIRNKLLVSDKFPSEIVKIC
ncbi:CDAN1-interacting nuclease 1 isoform X2 [Halyomorpha halys]|uniref:CDAN1-interacting nuclease 1 isoform X2 n=1 Tax=Halyomorpha halys TaxID=286706 RepID=UPI0034D3699D